MTQKFSGSIPTINANVIYEDVAFYKLPRKFSDFIIEKFIEMSENKIAEQIIDIKNGLKLIKNDEIESYKFIQNLINSKTEKELTLKLTVNENYYEVPTEFTELSDNEYYKVFHDETYKKQLNIKIKNIPITNVYEFMKENLDLVTNLGTIAINYQTLTNIKNSLHNYDSLIRT